MFQWTKVFYYHNPLWSQVPKYRTSMSSQNICEIVAISYNLFVHTILKLWHYAWQVTTSICNLMWQVLCGSITTGLCLFKVTRSYHVGWEWWMVNMKMPKICLKGCSSHDRLLYLDTMKFWFSIFNIQTFQFLVFSF